MFSVYSPVAGLEIWYPGLVLLGLITGIMTGLLGIGGGFVLTPSLRLLFNVSYPVAIGSTLLHIMLTATLSSYGHWTRKNVDRKLGIIMAAGSLAGAEAGVRLLRALSSVGLINIGGRAVPGIDLVLNSCFVVLMAGVAVFMLRESLAGAVGEPQTALAACLRRWAVPPLVAFEHSGITQISVWAPVAISLVVGCLAGLLGIGGGFIGLPLLIYAIGLPTCLAVGTSTFQVLIASAYGGLRYLQAGQVDYLLVFWLLLGSLAGLKIGIRLCGVFETHVTRRWFAILLLLAAAMVAYQAEILRIFH